MTDRALGALDDVAPSLFSRVLNIGGVVIVALLLWRADLLVQPGWVIVLAAVGLLCWLLREFVPLRSPVSVGVALLGVAASSLVATSTITTGYIAGLICVASLIATPRRPIALGLGAALGSAVLVAVDALVSHAGLSVLFGAAAGLAVATLAGVSRRQSRAAIARERDLLEERLRLEEERGCGAALAERSRIARDIHDVLAHSLGGLVIQLDAVDALLESGKVDDARARATAARGLAAAGLDDARRAVDALRDPDAAADPTATDPTAAIAELVATHRSLGAAADLHVTGRPVDLTADGATALHRAAQELLSNARRHAPGEQTSLTLVWAPDAATLRSATPLVDAAPATTGGGHGLAGLRERVTALGGSADWTVRDGAFVVTAVVPIAPEAAS